ncbi:MAG TPA: hypothetical protein VFY59_17410 [Rubrobacter sp.]|nr:hypothetical protein [Rubrobacter sp.]
MRQKQRTGSALQRYFSRDSLYLPAIPKVQLALLAGLALMAFVLPLTTSERLAVVVSAGVLAGLTWSTLNHVRRR